MAKKSTYKSKKRASSKKALRLRTKRDVIMFVILVIIGFAIYLLTSDDNPTIPTYSQDQNEEGFYYYQPMQDNDYYLSAKELIGNPLTLELRTLVNASKSLLTYGDIRYQLEVVDRDLNDNTKLLGLYNGVLLNATWDAGDTWDREHVWPNSRLGVPRISNTQRGIASDLHNLRAATGSINSSKSDRFFSAGSGIASTTNDGGFYPGDDYKGDVARILFYMVVTYDYLVLTDDLAILLDESFHYTEEGARMGQLSLLLAWHKEDPVSAFEISRNEKIYTAQGNRNPFIDRPEFVHLIWENKTIADLEKPDIDNQDISYQDNLITTLIKRRTLYGLIST